MGGGEFAALMDRLGPFETAPLLAIAVSGGADSLALCLLAADWARARGGKVVGVTVDHALRLESAAEARRVGGWLAAHSIDHCILTRTGPKPETGIQAFARQARYDLLQGWCADQGILHLLLAHHQDDQAETLLLRLGRGSGPDGLAAMAPIVERAAVRLLRPLLDVPHHRLTATLTALGQEWVEDPSNQNPHYQRVRLRQMMPALANVGIKSAGLAETARHFGALRQVRDQQIAQSVVRLADLHPAGWVRLDALEVARLPRDQALAVLGRVCRVVGGGVLPHRQDRLERLLDELLAGLSGRRTFGGCLLSPGRQGVVVCRELAAVASPVSVTGGQDLWWDRRFAFRLSGDGQGWVGALGVKAWAALRKEIPVPGLPSSVIPTLPALFDQHGVSAVPHLGYNRCKSGEKTSGFEAETGSDANPLRMDEIFFSPESQLAFARYCLV